LILKRKNKKVHWIMGGAPKVGRFSFCQKINSKYLDKSLVYNLNGFTFGYQLNDTT